MTRIIGISGKKQAGKTTSANWLHGLVLKERGLVEDFNVSLDGKLTIETFFEVGVKDWGVFDVQRTDDAFLDYAEENMWPYVKMYSFADTLKNLAVHLFNIRPEQVYGSEADKNSLTQFRWEDMPGDTSDIGPNGKICHHKGPMTAREFMQFFGTEIMRKMYPNIWVDNTIKRILAEGSELAVIPDVRFPNEVESILENGGEVIRLTRVYEEDDHASETCLDPHNFDQSKFTHIIENANVGMDGLFNKLTKIYRGA
jgi:hypothetical protein